MLKYGFFNSLNGDRVYDAEDMSAIFNNIITDGVFDNYGKFFATRASGSGMGIIVGTGRAWFNSTWTISDSDIALTVPAADVSLTRIDSVILEVNHTIGVRANSIKILKGTPSANPVAPTLQHGNDIYQHALANIRLAPGTATITNSMIDVLVGRSGCPFVTSVLESVAIDELFAKWENDFTTWFDDLKAQLSGDIVTNLQNQINQLNVKVDDIEINSSFDTRVYLEIKESTVWIAPSGIPNNEIIIACVGGGGGGGGSRGGGGGAGGYVEVQKISITPGASYNCIIGKGGAGGTDSINGENGGTTIFGNNLIVASGGEGGKWAKSATYSHFGGSGGSGGSGGGGGGANSETVAGHGGNGSKYGGGGGGGSVSSGLGAQSYGGNGGNGGTYGGGGGAGGGNVYAYNNRKGTVHGGIGGKGGAYSGDGGSAGSGSNEGAILYGNGENGKNGKAFSSSTNIFFPNAIVNVLGKGAAGRPGTMTGSGNYYYYYGGSGGGGGGYGGNGGGCYSYSTENAGISPGGSGGGGYGGNGGTVQAYGGSGGGGYGGNGGDGYVGGGGGGGFFADGGSGQTNSQLAKNGGTGAGGGGGTVPNNSHRAGDGGNGIIVLVYHKRMEE